MPKPLPRYLLTLRKLGSLTQCEVAYLLGISRSSLSRFERLERDPLVRIVIASEVIFGKRTFDMFPALYEEIEREVTSRAEKLFRNLQHRSDFKATEKKRFLLEIAKRARPSPEV
jgi:transcriptional regulator with XRE-family HTH domain